MESEIIKRTWGNCGNTISHRQCDQLRVCAILKCLALSDCIELIFGWPRVDKLFDRFNGIIKLSYSHKTTKTN